MLAILYLVLVHPLAPAAASTIRHPLMGIALYAAASAAEKQDAAVYALTGGTISGHLLKHVLVGAGLRQVVLTIRERCSAG